ncbi:low molecular weight phosphotyrosine protein phosphatase [Vibrio maritimus]|uniref:arsenate reductase/protein-tyrosine-phosphatase family protein n=1 Tax=Vibrio maritimus TaxID=990268 RepID=UPI004068B8D7
MFNNILVVCVGNICRSPTAERALQKLVPTKKVTSAGIAAEKSRLVGKTADTMAIDTASRYQLDVSNHSARQLTADMCRDNDLILVMEKGHIDAVCDIAPAARGKTMLFGQWENQQEIPDPYRQSQEAFDHVFKLIEQSASQWSKRL